MKTLHLQAEPEKMSKGLIATANIRIKAPIEKVWEALTVPELISKYMFGAEVISRFDEGSPILWRGVWNGKPYEDRGTILKKDHLKTLQLTHFSPMTGMLDTEENYHTLTYKLKSEGNYTFVEFSQDNNSDEKSRIHSQKNWYRMLESMKKMLEK